MPSRRYEEMSKADLLDEIRAIQGLLGDQGSLRALAEEYHVFQEEIRAQQAQLLEAQRALEDSRDRYADLFDFAPIGYATLDSSGVIREANLTAATMLEVERSRLLGYPLLIHVAQDERRLLLDHLTRCRAADAVVETRIRLRTKKGHVFVAKLVSRRADRTNHGVMWHTAIIDLTEQERAEEERLRLLREEQSLRASSEAKDRFLAVLSHELRTPLTPILFTLEAIQRRSGLPAELLEPINVMRRNVELEARLIDDLLDTTRIARGKLHMSFDVVDAHAALAEGISMSAHDVERARLTLRSELRATSHHVRGDATRLRQVIWNLLSNAVRYTPPGGTIVVRTSNPDGARLEIAVEDDGRGIDPALLARIFDPFEQGREAGPRAGLGLGLSISKGIVEAHGGRIAAYSEGPDKGTRFEIELATVAKPHDSAAAEPAAEASREKPRILLVEDHPDTAQSLLELLQLHGYEVALAGCVAEALGHDARFEVLVTDIGLPDGDGLQILRTLRERRPVQGIALSGYGSNEDVAQSRAAGFVCHLTKPVDFADLLRAIEQLGDASARVAGM